MKGRMIALLASIVLIFTIQFPRAFADTPTPEQADRYEKLVRFILDASQRRDQAALQSISSDTMKRYIDGDGVNPIFDYTDQIGQIGDVKCVYVVDDMATVTIDGSNKSAYFNVAVTDDGKWDGYGLRFYKDGDDMFAPYPTQAYRSVVDAIVVDINDADYQDVEDMMSPHAQADMPLASTSSTLRKIAGDVGTIETIKHTWSFVDSGCFRLIGTKGSADLAVYLTFQGLICRLTINPASSDDPSAVAKFPSEVTPSVRTFQDAVNRVDVAEFDAISADNVLAQLPPDKAQAYLNSIHSVTGDLVSVNYKYHDGDEFIYILSGTNGNVRLALTPDAGGRFTWFNASLVDDTSMAAKAHLSIPDLKLKRMANGGPTPTSHTVHAPAHLHG